MLACVCGFIVEGLILFGGLGLSLISIPIANAYNNWCRRKHVHNCKRHDHQVVPVQKTEDCNDSPRVTRLPPI
jgi:hypothetical protein